MEVFLTEEQKKELLSELRLERNRKYADRIRIILLLDKGEPISQIAKYFYLTDNSVRSYKNRYIEDGLEGLLIDYQLGRSSYLSPEEQQAFVKKYNRIKEKKGLIYFADSTHPMLNPVLSSGWIRKGKEYEVKTNSGRQRVNINGAIEVNRLTVVSRSCKRVNGSSMCDLLRAIRIRHPNAKKIHLILDNAPYNKSKQLKDVARELKIKILYLPAYSPNLNPIERLWKYMKREVMANRYFPDVETFQKELMLFLRGIRKHRQELSSLITDNFHIVKT